MTGVDGGTAAVGTSTGPPRMPLALPAAVTPEMIRDYAIHEGVCIRPVLRKVTDRATGDQHTIPIPCGATRDYRCPPCAAKARRVDAKRRRSDTKRNRSRPGSDD